MPNWNHTDRGVMHDQDTDRRGYDGATDWDAKSDADYWQLPGRGLDGIEGVGWGVTAIESETN